MSLVDRVTALLGNGGAFARRWPAYEGRTAQLDMARDVARTLESGGVLMAEAPTGVGKSLAYLLPAVLLARERDARVVVATCTRSLQDQLFERDLPAVLAVLDMALPVARLKGKQNYLCPRALEIAEPRGAEEQPVIDGLRAWAVSDESGDLDRFPADDAEAYRRVRPRVAADPSTCTGATCRRGRECFWIRARRRAAEARLTIVNHALLARAAESDGLLPEADVLIVDEAHRLEGVLSSQLERGVSRHRFEELLRLTGTALGARRGSGLLGRMRGFALPLMTGADQRERLAGDLERLSERTEHARADVERFFLSLSPPEGRTGLYGARARYRSAEELMGRDLQPLEVVLEHAHTFADALRRSSGSLSLAESGPEGEELAGELEIVAGRWSKASEDLADLVDAGNRDWVYWRATNGGGRGGPPAVELRGAPVSVAAHARHWLLSPPRAVVLTSATLSSGGDFRWAGARLGLGEEQGLPFDSASYPTPFPLDRQMRAFVYEGGGDEAESVSDVIAALADACERRMLVLLTAHERLRRVRERVAGRLPPGRVLLAQEWDGSAAQVVDRFRASPGAVLLGVQSLWEGVDFPGDALELLVVAKLPFSVPDDPLVEARAERIRERGGEPFREDAVPEAVLRFRQGVGRLIRRSDDRGVLVVCDPRLANASYRRPFLAALPVLPGVGRDARALAAEAARFLAAGTVTA